MKDKSISTKQFLKNFEKEVKRLGGSKSAAKHFDVTRAFIDNVICARELPGTKILKKMKLRPVRAIKYRYEKI